MAYSLCSVRPYDWNRAAQRLGNLQRSCMNRRPVAPGTSGRLHPGQSAPWMLHHPGRWSRSKGRSCRRRRSHRQALWELRLSRPSVTAMIALRPETSFSASSAAIRASYMAVSPPVLIAIDGAGQNGVILGQLLDVVYLRVVDHQAGLIAGTHLIDVGLGGRLGAVDLAVLVHAAGNIHDQHGGERPDAALVAAVHIGRPA